MSSIGFRASSTNFLRQHQPPLEESFSSVMLYETRYHRAARIARVASVIPYKLDNQALRKNMLEIITKSLKIRRIPNALPHIGRAA